MSEYRCSCGSQWFRVNTELEDKVIVVCAGCEWRAEAPSLAEAFQKIREKPEPKDGAP